MFEKLKAELDKLELDNWDKIVIDLNKQVSNLEILIKSLQNELLLGKTYKFLSIIQSLKREIKSAKVTKMVNLS